MTQRFDLQRAFHNPRSHGVDRIVTALFVPSAARSGGVVVALDAADRTSRRKGSPLAADGGAASRFTRGASP